MSFVPCSTQNWQFKISPMEFLSKLPSIPLTTNFMFIVCRSVQFSASLILCNLLNVTIFY